MLLKKSELYHIQIHSLKKKYLIDLSHLFSSMALINEIMNTPLLFIINTCVVLLWVFAASIMSSLLQSCNQHFRGFTYPLVFDCWLLDHVIYLKLRKKVLFLSWANSQNDNYFHSKWSLTRNLCKTFSLVPSKNPVTRENWDKLSVYFSIFEW